MQVDMWYDLMLRELSGDDVARELRAAAAALHTPIPDDERDQEPEIA
jgi:hypothetical protein